jgi:hypothetical protein
MQRHSRFGDWIGLDLPHMQPFLAEMVKEKSMHINIPRLTAALHCSALSCAVQCRSALSCSVQCRRALSSAVVHCRVVVCTVLPSPALSYTVLH